MCSGDVAGADLVQAVGDGDELAVALVMTRTVTA
jgi:hypothetical protein